jgi:hypothetical protein
LFNYRERCQEDMLSYSSENIVAYLRHPRIVT